MGSPQRLFRFLTDAQLEELRTEGYSAALEGQFISTGGAGKAGTKQRLDLATFLLELNAELQARGLVDARPQKVTQILSYPPTPAEPVYP